MYCLPSVEVSGAPRRLPLAQGAAQALLEVALAGGDLPSWRRALGAEPYLALWARAWTGAGDAEIPAALATGGESIWSRLESATARPQRVSNAAQAACRAAAGSRQAAVSNVSPGAWRRRLRLLADEPDDLLAALGGKAPQASLAAGDSWRPADAGEVRSLRAAAALVRRTTVAEARFDERLRIAKLDALKELAYGASHEVNNPLANISMLAQSLLADEASEERRLRLGTIHAQAMRAHEMISDLMYFARPPVAERRRTDLAELLQRAAATVREEAAAAGVIVELDSDAAPTAASVDPDQFVVAAAELLRNGVEAQPEGGRVRLTLRRDESTGHIVLEASDDGPGLAEEVREHLFDPFYSGREAGRGLGFGLSKAWRIAEMHGGSLHCAPSQRGAHFVLSIPDESPVDDS